MKTIKLYNHYSAFYPTTTTYGKSCYINPLADPTFTWTASSDEEKMISDLDCIFERKFMIKYLNSIMAGKLCFYHSEYQFEYLDEKVVVKIYYKGHRYLSVQEKTAKGYDTEKAVGAAGSLELTQKIVFKSEEDEAGNRILIIEDEPTIEIVEFVDDKKQSLQNELFSCLADKYPQEKPEDNEKFTKLITVLAQFNMNMGMTMGTALRNAQTFARELGSDENVLNFITDISLIEEGEHKGKIFVKYSGKFSNSNEAEIYDFSLESDKKRLNWDLVLF